MRILLLIFIIFFNLKSYAEPVRYVYEGYVRGNDFLQYNNNEKSKYIMGVADGLLSSEVYLNKDSEADALSNIVKLRECLRTTIDNNNQLVAIVEKYLSNNPEEWSLSMNIIFFESMKDVCKLVI